MRLGLADATPALPTYKTAAAVLEKQKGSGLALVGWTVARTFLIAPPMMIVGVPVKQAFAGAAFASTFISIFTVLRIFNARTTGFGGTINPKCLASPRRARARR